MRSYYNVLLLSLLCSCVAGNKGATPIVADDVCEGYVPPAPPAVVTDPQQIAEFYRYHYWDNFDIHDSAAVMSPDTGMMVSAFTEYVRILSGVSQTDAAPIEDLMHRVSGTKTSLDMFSMIADRVLADPNSSYRNDEFFIPVLETRLASGYYDKADSIRDRHRLDIAMQNRIGRKANDIRYTLIDGTQGTLYGIHAEYVLVFINNPGCGMCRTVREDICSSQLLVSLIKQGVLRVLAIYPDEDLDEWRKYYGNIPSDWINGYDKGCVIRKSGSYNLGAIPALYLLDADKNVLVKDGTDAGELERILGSDNNY